MHYVREPTYRYAQYFLSGNLSIPKPSGIIPCLLGSAKDLGQRQQGNKSDRLHVVRGGENQIFLVEVDKAGVKSLHGAAVIEKGPAGRVLFDLPQQSLCQGFLR